MRHSRAMSAGHLPGQRRRRARLSLGPRRAMLAVTASAAALALAAAGCASSSSVPPTGGTRLSGGTAVFAEPPATVPNYIWPYTSITYSSVININDFQYLMYRPLYWFGNGSQPTLNQSLSLANPPTFSGKDVTITLKHYVWSNGQPVTAQDVVFWLNMELAEPANYGPYIGFPANVSGIKAVSPTTVTMTMSKAYSPTWFLYNDLSQVTPMPEAWDRTASGPSDCSTNVKACAKVYTYLDAQSKALSTYVSSPLWRIVDGPWKLGAFNADGHVTMVPNKSYTGPVKPTLSQFQMVPFTTDAAEYDVLQSSSSSSPIDYGYLPEQDAPAKSAGAAAGSNPSAVSGHYVLYPWYSWSISYFPLNFQSTVSDHAAIFKQLYFREALQYLMNQAAVIAGPLRGYGYPTVGPVGNTAPNPYLSATGKAGDPFPYNPTKAKDLLSSHGWKVAPNGVTTCTAPRRCGPGIKARSALSFTLPYATGLSWLASEMAQLQSNAALVGIRLSLEPKPFNQVTAIAGGNCVVAKISCAWDAGDWGGGWTFSPDYLPTGETLFMTGAVANSGGYADPNDDALINKTLTSSSLRDMYAWQDYLAPKLPVIYQPNAAYQLSEIATNLRGATPLSPTLSINPENWYFVK
jgi:peptide/nickel transport system substrate-binding protein